MCTRLRFFPVGSDGRLGHELTMAVLRAEVWRPWTVSSEQHGGFIHRMDRHSVHTAATDSPPAPVRVQVITPPAL